MAKITLYGASWCAPCGDMKKFLEKNGIPFEYKDCANDIYMKELIDKKIRSMPVFMNDKGEVLIGVQNIDTVKRFGGIE